MSHDVGITIKLATPTGYASSLEALEAAGREIRDGTGASFISEAATDFADWLISQPVSVERVREIVSKRDKLGKFAGVVLMYRGTLHGCNLLWPDRSTLVLSPSINRVKLTGGWTDASWYVTRVCQPLLDRGHKIESLNLHETGT